MYVALFSLDRLYLAGQPQRLSAHMECAATFVIEGSMIVIYYSIEPHHNLLY